MNTDPFMLVDRERRQVFGWLAETCRPFKGASVAADGAGVPWLWAAVGGSAVGLTWLGPGRVWDAEWAAAHADELAERRASVRATPTNGHRLKLEGVVAELRLGDLARRVLYAVHRAVLAQKSSVLTVADGWLAEMCWGGQSARPRHWRSVLREVLRGLAWLHVADRVADGPPAFGPQTVLITHSGDFRGTGQDPCPGDCGARGQAHHHFQIDVGPGFLGILERFGQVDAAGVRRYRFPVSGRRAAATLRDVGKSGRLVSAFAPALLGEPAKCRTVGAGGHRILQALVRETTRAAKPQPDADTRGEVLTGGRVKTWSGRSTIRCELLGHDGPLVGFNGNGKRKAMGFRLGGEWGWLPKAGYPADAVPAFLDDLAALAEPLRLAVVGVGPSNAFYTLPQLRGLAESATGRRQLDGVDIRVFGPADYVRRWSSYFGVVDEAGGVTDRPALDVLAEMRARGLSRRAVAASVGCDHSFLSRVLNGRKSWPEGLLNKVLAHLVVGRHGRTPKAAKGESPKAMAAAPPRSRSGRR